MLESLAPPAALPWRPHGSLAVRLRRLAVFSAAGPLLLLAFGLDRLAAPLILHCAGSNAYRIIAQKVS
jgi:hypothetical protein